MSKNPLYQCFLGELISPTNDKHCTFVKKGGLVLKRGKKDEYRICHRGTAKSALDFVQHSRSAVVHDFGNRIIMPAFYDMHFHWVQDDVRLMPKNNLLKWLSKYTWPYEHKFRSKSYSRARARVFSEELLSEGTIGGAVYASIHPHSVEHALDSFIGDYTVGNVLMTMNSPDYLTMSEEESLKHIEFLSKKYKTSYCLTPRFAPTTSPHVMKEGIKLCLPNKSFVQTHLSETLDEIKYVLELYKKIPGFEDVENYLEIYDRCGLLSPKTIMGHGIYLSNDEWKTLSKTKTSVAHCPTSNAPRTEKGLGSGLFDFKKADRHGVRWALATDIGGGPFLSMIDVIRSFVDQNKKEKKSPARLTLVLSIGQRWRGPSFSGLEKHMEVLMSGSLETFWFCLK